MSDLFQKQQNNENSNSNSYDAKDIVVLEGLEPVRKRPGMYIGGTDEAALHHLVNEVFDNAMDEAVAGYASIIEVELYEDGSISIKDNGRGIPVDPHPKYPNKSALEVILTTLHSGGKFHNKVYNTSGGLNGVGISVVNALSDRLEIEVFRNKKSYKQIYSRGQAETELTVSEANNNKKGCFVKFHPDSEIFGNASFKATKLYKLARSKAYLYKGVEIRWKCASSLIRNQDKVPESENIKFPGGLKDFLNMSIIEKDTLISEIFCGEATINNTEKKIEWAVTWLKNEEGFSFSYCNTIPTPLGGSHENGFKNALLRALKAYGEMLGNKKAALLITEDISINICSILSVFIHDPQFQGQTKDKLTNSNITKIVEQTIRDHFDNWLASNKKEADVLLEFVIENSEERLMKKQPKDTARKSIIQKIRLPGKLADCTRKIPVGTEIFLVEGDSAGGSAKQARDRETQAVLPLRGKVLNVANSTNEKIKANQELIDLELALGCGTLNHYRDDNLRYEKVIIMTDADVDGAHIASLLMTYFYKQMQGLIHNGHLYIAQPPLYRISANNKSYYAVSEAEKEKIIKELSKNKHKIEIGRFKGLGEMNAKQLKETTMDPLKRKLIKVKIDDISASDNQLNRLMGKKPELRFEFIQEQALINQEFINNKLDI